MYKKILTTEELLEMVEIFKKWSGQKTSSKAILWALRFTHKYHPLIEKMYSDKD